MLYYIAFSLSLYLIIYLAMYLFFYMIARTQCLHLFRDVYPVLCLPGEPVSDSAILMERIRQLYLARIITNINLEDDFVSFEDRSLSLVHNIYYIRFANPRKLYYRGFAYKYQYHRIKLRSIAAFLSDAHN